MQPSDLIDQQIRDAPDWRGQTMASLRQVIHEADPEIGEEWKWSTAVFVHNGNVCAIAAFKDHVKINFFRGAALNDPHGLFNAGLDAKATRAIDYFEGDHLRESELKDLIREAVTLNRAKKK
jgi:hypothetical protein